MNNNHDIHERIYQFVVRGLKIIRFVPKTPENLIIINQFTRSLTSMGANDQEADGTMTKKDFIAKYTIVRKEAKETYYWLRLLSDINSSLKTRMQSILQENEEIIRIVSTIITKTRSK